MCRRHLAFMRTCRSKASARYVSASVLMLTLLTLRVACAALSHTPSSRSGERPLLRVHWTFLKATTRLAKSWRCVSCTAHHNTDAR